MKVPAFIPSYESALVINDLITAVLLFGQFTKLRSPAICALASGYLFTALMAVSHALTFPGLYASGGLLGAVPTRRRGSTFSGTAAFRSPSSLMPCARIAALRKVRPSSLCARPSSPPSWLFSARSSA